ncbi:protoporphyrinogen/coproporphyrinogen oxidase [Microbacterium sp.]|uniref:protoporphyrinogen/coproporphyrinogen oxidase n=1 Tax=Microbacterium sp. TaxID=51671 RepID=UPI003A9529BD
MRVIVIGGGVAGLVAARACAAGGAEVTVLEAGAEPGGSVARSDVAGLSLDAAAESFATRGGAVQRLLAELGLTERIEWPNPAGAWLHLPDRTVPMPRGGLLGIPIDPLADDVVAAIGPDAARRAQRDLDEPAAGDAQAPAVEGAVSLGALVRDRMGDAVLDRLVSPVVTGVYSAAPDDLDVDVIAPGLRAAFARTGSLARAVQELREAVAWQADAHRDVAAPSAHGGPMKHRGPAKPGGAVGGLRGGMWTLVDALVADLDSRGVRVETNASVTALTRSADGSWRVTVAATPARRADAVVVATDGPTAIRLLSTAGAPSESAPERPDVAGAAASVAGLGGIDWPAPTRVELVTLVLDAPELDAAPRGTGLLVAGDAHADVTAKALTHSTDKWPWLAAQTTPGRHVVRLSYGSPGIPNPVAVLDDAAVHDLALRDASRLLGVTLTPTQVAGFARRTWMYPRSHATAGQAARVRAVRAAVGGVHGLEIAGAWVAGTGLASVIPDAMDAAARALA